MLGLSIPQHNILYYFFRCRADAHKLFGFRLLTVFYRRLGVFFPWFTPVTLVQYFNRGSQFEKNRTRDAWLEGFQRLTK
jgi:hypothetical protein